MTLQLLIGKKLGMTQVFAESGSLIPVSVIKAGPCPIVQVKTPEHDGYAAVQIGFDETKEGRLGKPKDGHCKKAGVSPQRILKEVRVEDVSGFKVGESLDVKGFELNDKIHVVGRAKGRGFAGVIKRHGFSRGPETHGSKAHRIPGSIGLCATPSRVFKGKRLPGRLGGHRTTVKNLRVVQIDPDNNLIYVKGAVPGATNGIVLIKKD